MAKVGFLASNVSPVLFAIFCLFFLVSPVLAHPHLVDSDPSTPFGVLTLPEDGALFQSIPLDADGAPVAPVPSLNEAEINKPNITQQSDRGPSPNSSNNRSSGNNNSAPLTKSSK